MNEAELIERCEKRDVFAAAALQGILANPTTNVHGLAGNKYALDALVVRAYEIAEFMVHRKATLDRADMTVLLDE